MDTCSRAEGLEWVVGPWWQLDQAELDEPKDEGNFSEAGGADWDPGGGVGLVYLVAGGETAAEYGARVSAWRTVLRGAPRSLRSVRRVLEWWCWSGIGTGQLRLLLLPRLGQV